jgi:hypothetical protein
MLLREYFWPKKPRKKIEKPRATLEQVPFKFD